MALVGLIYKTTNTINGKIYIGQTTRSKKSYLGGGSYLLKAIKKYGRENFIREIVEEVFDNKETLNQREIYWINFFNSRNPQIGYNLSSGGDGGAVGFFSALPVEEQNKRRRFFSEHAKNIWKDERRLKKLSELTKKRNAERWSNSDEKNKMSAITKKNWSDPAYKERVSKSISAACGARTEEEIAAIVQKSNNTKKNKTPEEKFITSRRMSDSKRGKVSPFKGKKRILSEETLNKMKMPKPKSTCEHCGAVCDILNLKRWHNDRCKKKEML